MIKTCIECEHLIHIDDGDSHDCDCSQGFFDEDNMEKVENREILYEKTQCEEEYFEEKL
jgi:hypothetical protein